MGKIFWISASKLISYDKCPRQIKYKYIDKLPTIDEPYFKFWREVERIFYEIALEWKELSEIKIREEQCAVSFINDEKLMKEIKYWKAETQNEYKIVKCKDCWKWTRLDKWEWKIEKCNHCKSNNLENWGLIWYTDYENERAIIDLKAYASSWNRETIMQNIWQALMYDFFAEYKKDFYFAIVNKTNFKTQFLKINFTEETRKKLFVKIQELLLAKELMVFPKKNGFHCKFCPFKKFCDIDLD